jgi:hypothetical protein
MCERTIRYILFSYINIRKGLCKEHQARLAKLRKLMRNTSNVPHLLQAEVCVRPEPGSRSSATEAPSRGGGSSLGSLLLDTTWGPQGWLRQTAMVGTSAPTISWRTSFEKGPY